MQHPLQCGVWRSVPDSDRESKGEGDVPWQAISGGGANRRGQRWHSKVFSELISTSSRTGTVWRCGCPETSRAVRRPSSRERPGAIRRMANKLGTQRDPFIAFGGTFPSSPAKRSMLRLRWSIPSSSKTDVRPSSSKRVANQLLSCISSVTKVSTPSSVSRSTLEASKSNAWCNELPT